MDDPAISELLSFFDFAHLPPHLAEVSRPFHDVAHDVAPLHENANVREAMVPLVALLDSLDGNEAREARLKCHYATGEANRARCLRLLLEAKDCAVRAAVVRHRDGEHPVANRKEGLQVVRTPEEMESSRRAARAELEATAADESDPDAAAYAREYLAIADREERSMPDDEPHSEVGSMVGAALSRASIPISAETIAAFLEGQASRRDQDATARAVEPKRERLADFVVGIDVEQGPGFAALRDLVAKLETAVDRLEALPDDVDQAHVEALRGLHNAPPPVIVSRKVRTFTDEDDKP